MWPCGDSSCRLLKGEEESVLLIKSFSLQNVQEQSVRISSRPKARIMPLVSWEVVAFSTIHWAYLISLVFVLYKGTLCISCVQLLAWVIACHKEHADSYVPWRLQALSISSILSRSGTLPYFQAFKVMTVIEWQLWISASLYTKLHGPTPCFHRLHGCKTACILLSATLQFGMRAQILYFKEMLLLML